nr:unnamed protein product [Callosobruchus analis]
MEETETGETTKGLEEIKKKTFGDFFILVLSWIKNAWLLETRVRFHQVRKISIIPSLVDFSHTI